MAARPLLLIAERSRPSGRLLFRFRLGLRDARTLTRMIFNLDWPDRTSVQVTLSESENMAVRVSRGPRGAAVVRDVGSAGGANGRGEIAVVAEGSGDLEALRRALDDCAVALRQFGFEDVEVIGFS